MEIRVERTDSQITIAVSGSLNTNTAPDLEQVVDAEIPLDGSVQLIVFDCSDLDYISSAGLRVLMVAYKKIVTVGGKIRIEHANDEVQEVLDITGFAEIFES